jgi:CheY-like chemotaxis protein
MSIRREHRKSQTNKGTSPLDQGTAVVEIGQSGSRDGGTLSSRNQAQLDDDRELAQPDDIGHAAHLRQRQRDIDFAQGRDVRAVSERPSAPVEERRPPAAEAPHTRVASIATARPRVIIADDDPVVRAMLEMSLGDQFDLVGTAADGEQTIELAADSQPDAAIIDVEMPKGGGLFAVRGIVDMAPGTAIVMLSGDESDGAVRELMAAGATAYRRKGIAPEFLAQSVTDSIRVHAMHRGHAGC